MSELYHHQIEGAHWGQRNGPPYPLNPEDHTAEQLRKNPEIKRELKAQKVAAKVERKKAKSAAKAEIRVAKFKAKLEKSATKALKKGDTDKIRKKAQAMSEDELNDRIKRLDLEKRYISLEKELNPEKKKRDSIAKGMIENVLKNIGTQALTAIAGNAWNKFVTEHDHPEFTVNPKKGQKDK